MLRKRCVRGICSALLYIFAFAMGMFVTSSQSSVSATVSYIFMANWVCLTIIVLEVIQ